MIEKIGASALKWLKELYQAVVVGFDARLVALIVVVGAMAVFVIPATLWPILKASAQFTIYFVFAVAIAHALRKILLSDGFKLKDFWGKALESPIASSVVYASTLAFTAFLINHLLSLLAIKP